MMEIDRPSVTLLTATPNAQKIIEICGRKSYGSAESDTEQGTYNWIKARIRGWEHDVLEHASATFLFTCSRVCSHQLVRHRIAAYTQESQRFKAEQAEDLTLVPYWVHDEDVAEWLDDYQKSYAIYQKWVGRGYQRQQSRYHLVSGARTHLAATWNFRQIRHIIEMRTPKKADPEFRQLAIDFRNICVENWPAVFDEYKEKELA